MDLIFYENVILKFMFTREQLKDRLLPYFKSDLFDDFTNKQISIAIEKFGDKYDRFPSIAEMKMELDNEEQYNKFMSVINQDISEFSDDYLIGETEDFIRNKLALSSLTECAKKLRDGQIEEAKGSPDALRTALSFSFDSSVAYNPFDDPDMLWNQIHNKEKRIPFNIQFLDRWTKGGAPRKTLAFFLAETNLGKTLIMSSLAANDAINGYNVLYITCEMAKELIGERMVSNVWDYDINELEFIEKDTFLKMFKVHKQRVESRINIEEFPPSTINANNIRTLIKELEIKKGFKPDRIYIDYITLMRPIYSKRADNSYAEYKRTAEEVRAIAVELNLSIISAIQTNRSGMGMSELGLNNTSDSIGLSFTGDIVIAVTQSEEFRDMGKYAMAFLKNRAGINKMRGACDVDYTRMRIYDGGDNDHIDQNALRKSNQQIEEAENILHKSMAINSVQSDQEVVEWQ